MSQANLAWQLMMGADDKIVIGTLNRDAWKSTELAQKEGQCVVRSSRYTETNKRIDELCRCKSSNIIAESDTKSHEEQTFSIRCSQDDLQGSRNSQDARLGDGSDRSQYNGRKR